MVTSPIRGARHPKIERERAKNEVTAAMKEISSDCHLNEKRRPLKVADSRRKTRTKQSKKKNKKERRVVRESNQTTLEKEERKSRPEVYKSNSEDTDQQK